MGISPHYWFEESLLKPSQNHNLLIRIFYPIRSKILFIILVTQVLDHSNTLPFEFRQGQTHYSL